MGDIQALTEIDYPSVFIAVFTILVGLKAIISIGEFFASRLGLETKSMRQKREDHELLVKTSENLSALQEKHNHDDNELKECLFSFVEETRKENETLRSEMRQFTENRIHDREQSFKIQKELIDAQNGISKSVSSLISEINLFKNETNERFDKNEEKENQRVQSDIKDRISRYYQIYHENKSISSMELEGLKALIETYELHGGMNSFVHDVVQKEMYTWEVR